MRVLGIQRETPPTQVHQPRMKVFTVGLDEKEKTKNLDEKVEIGSVIVEPKATAQVSPPPVVQQKKVHKGPFRTWLSCLLAVFFVLIIALTLSEIAYNRHRDEQYLRLKWAELKQRMLGMEILRQSQIQAQQSAINVPINPAQSLNNDQPPEIIDERLAFSKRLEKENNEVETNRVDNSAEHNSGDEENGDVRLAFLKAILEKIRTAAANGDLPSPVHVSVLEIKKQPLIGENEEDIEEMPQNMADGFGEWAAPSPFGPVDFQQNEGRQFDRLTWRGDRFPQQVENSGEAQPWMFNDDGAMNGPMEGPMEGPMNGPMERPQLRITHHFDRDNAMMPARIVTELYGDDASEFMRNFMNGRRGEEMNQPPIQQSLQFPMTEPQQWMGPQMMQPTPDQQRFAAEFGQTFGTNFGLNWERAQQQKQMPWQQFSAQQSFAQPQQMNAWQQWQNQWQQPQQQQAAIQPAQSAQASLDSQQLPWYQNWIQENKAQQHLPVDQKFNKEEKVDEEPKFTDLNEEDQGDDGFERKEQFNVPTDVIVDEQPEVVENGKNDEPISTVVNNQPAAAIEVEPIKEPESSAAFLPPRDQFDDPPPPKDAHNQQPNQEPFIPPEAISNDDTFTIDKNSPFFQIDDPSSFAAKA
ncbi:unnamed protein product, partial [Mesorhabditis belari]|uniref:Uncharacterized protein n=1 Tax=Mesorhabditis belari TaxID=2138241 RepID=A0AAF3ETW1_9BILA